MSFWSIVTLAVLGWVALRSYRGRGPISGTITAVFSCIGVVILVNAAVFLGIIGRETVRTYDEKTKGTLGEKLEEAHRPYFEELQRRDPQAPRFTEEEIAKMPGQNAHF